MFQTSFKNLSLHLLLISAGLLLPVLNGFGQSISGYITDENKEPVPFANVFIRELNTGTSANEKGYYFMTIDVGIYHVVFSSVGYEARTEEIIVGDKPLIKNISLQAASAQLNEIVVKANKKDPAYEIINRVIEHKEKFLNQVKSARASVYMRATETTDDTKKKAIRAEAEENLDMSKGIPPGEEPAEIRKKEEAELKK
jgi:hypothetical protein